MYRVITDFLEDWNYESDATLRVFQNISDSTLNKVVVSDGRSIKDIAWHITITIGEMLSKAGMAIENFHEDAAAPNTINEIISEYERLSKKAEEYVIANWKDENLQDDVNMYGEMWKKGKILAILIRHQSHHRAQLTILMRQAGLMVPGVYGPSKEEWKKYRMPPQK